MQKFGRTHSNTLLSKLYTLIHQLGGKYPVVKSSRYSQSHYRKYSCSMSLKLSIVKTKMHHESS